MLWDPGGGWPLVGLLDQLAKPSQRRSTIPIGRWSRPDELGTRDLFSASSHERALRRPLVVSGGRRVGSPNVSRPRNYEHYRWLGDKRTQIVYDLDADDLDQSIIDDIEG